MTNLKLKSPVPFPASMSGSGVFTISKSNGVWTGGLDFSLVTEMVSVSDPANTLLVVYDAVNSIFKHLNINTIGAGLSAITISGHALHAGDTLNLAQADITGLKTTDTPVFVGLGGTGPTAATQLASDNSTKIATTAWGNAFLTAQIGVSVQAYSARLTTFAGLAATANRGYGTDGSGNPVLITYPAAGLSLAGGAIALSNDLSALEGLGSTGIAVRTATDTWAQRTITAANGISITNGNGVSGNPTIALSSDAITQRLLNSMANARNGSIAQFYGMAFADSFGATTYYDSGNSSNVDTGTAGLLKPTTNVQVPQASGSTIGSMTSNGGLAAAFDGTTSQGQSACAAAGTSVSGYNNTVGKNWGAGVKRIINEVKLWAPNNAGALAAGGTTFKIQGSNDGSAWTDLYTSGTLLAGSSTTADINSGITATTAYQYHRVNGNGDGASALALAEVQFWTSVQNAMIRSTAITTPSVPTAITVVARIKHVDTATAGTDYTLSVSRDGGTTFTTLSLTDYFTDPTDSAHTIVAAECDVSGQPSGSSVVLRMDTANSKMVELRDWGFSAR